MAETACAIGIAHFVHSACGVSIAAAGGGGICIAGIIRGSGSDEDLIRFFERDCSLVRTQLPREDIPKLVARCTCRIVKPGDVLIKQGVMQKELFFVYKGEVQIERTEDGKICRHSTLMRGCHWGDGSLARGRPSAATLRALGGDLIGEGSFRLPKKAPDDDAEIPGVEVLCLKKKDFDELGFRDVTFPERPAIYERKTTDPQVEELDGNDARFIVNAIKNNSRLEDALQVTWEQLEQDVRKATVNTYPAGDVITMQNEFSRGAFIIRTGTAEVSKEKIGRGTCDAWVMQRMAKPQEMIDDRKILKPGDIFGELSMLHGTRRLATLRANTDAQVYFLPRHVFQRCFKGAIKNEQEVIRLLDDCSLFSTLLTVQRRELGRYHSGFQDFEPNYEINTGRFWYVVAGGYGKEVKEDTGCLEDDAPDEFRRGDVFGLGTIPGAEGVAFHKVKVGERGMKALLFDEEVVQKFRSCLPRAMTRRISREQSHGELCPESPAAATLYQSIIDTDSLRSIGFLGRGAFGLVILQEDENGNRYALKRISKGLVVMQNSQKETSFEKDLTSLLSRSPFTTRLYRSWKDDQFVYMLLDAELGGDLAKLLRDEEKLFTEDSPPGKNTRFYIACIAEAFGYLQDRFVVFRDLKPENVMISSNGFAKLVDFGLSRFTLKPLHVICGTANYMAPEMQPQVPSTSCFRFFRKPVRGDGKSSGYNFLVDWWALGVLAFELLSGGTMPFGFVDNTAEFPDYANMRPFPLRVRVMKDSAPRDFIMALLQQSPKRRLGAKGVKSVREHPWMKEVDFTELKANAIGVGMKNQIEPPYVPPEFQVAVPAPELWNENGDPVKIPFTKHEGFKLNGMQYNTKDTLDEAMAVCRQHEPVSLHPDDRLPPMGFNVPTPGRFADDKVIVKHFGRGTEPSLEEARGWTAYRSHGDLFVEYDEEADEDAGWDNIFDETAMAAPLRAATPQAEREDEEKKCSLM